MGRHYARAAGASLTVSGLTGMLGGRTAGPMVEFLHVFSDLLAATRD